MQIHLFNYFGINLNAILKGAMRKNIEDNKSIVSFSSSSFTFLTWFPYLTNIPSIHFGCKDTYFFANHQTYYLFNHHTPTDKINFAESTFFENLKNFGVK